jgi:hypothetical protein
MVCYMPPRFQNCSRRTKKTSMQSFSDCILGWSKELQWENKCGSFLPCFLLVTWPSWMMWQTHIPTFNKWHKTTKKKKTLTMLTHGAMRQCGLTSLVVCMNDKHCDIRKRNMTIRSEIWTTNICSLEFWDIRGCVTLWGLILRHLGCTPKNLKYVKVDLDPKAPPATKRAPLKVSTLKLL